MDKMLSQKYIGIFSKRHSTSCILVTKWIDICYLCKTKHPTVNFPLFLGRRIIKVVLILMALKCKSKILNLYSFWCMFLSDEFLPCDFHVIYCMFMIVVVLYSSLVKQLNLFSSL